ncbi:sugar phosphate isomerase/epimerase family protein [Falsibacillus albus]|uniref:Sugar phosphate isomerase/epimerase n=1 Tax=Falsibacillus albus TaxID=2478915 RepID=A0A3L7K0L6_9BACI|nr:sugar phosphate isomerase/epimerase [Falsibacillus albus]RLQ96608.1 sugar phosphate isomerase/epimerase [Falsibacillus albus]
MMEMGCHLFPWNAMLQNEGVFSKKVSLLLSWIKENGFNSIEIGSHFIPYGKEKEFDGWIKQHGLKIAGVHTGKPFFLSGFQENEMEDVAKDISRLKEAGAERILFSTWGSKSVEKERVSALIQHLHLLGGIAHEHSISLLYHNHDHEFLDGASGAERIMKETDPKLVSFALDIGWIQLAGVDIFSFWEAHQNRIEYVHLRDVRDCRFVEIGEGEIDYVRVVYKMKETKKLKAAIIEMELGDNYGGGFTEPEKSVLASYHHLQTNLNMKK